jgi:hypothetical protein
MTLRGNINNYGIKELPKKNGMKAAIKTFTTMKNTY